MQQIKRIGVWSVAKVFLLFGLFFGLLMGTYSAFVLPKIIAANPDLAAIYGTVTTGSSLTIFITVIVTYIVLMFLSGVIGSALYNLFAKLVGGITVELTEKKKK